MSYKEFKSRYDISSKIVGSVLTELDAHDEYKSLWCSLGTSGRKDIVDCLTEVVYNILDDERV